MKVADLLRLDPLPHVLIAGGGSGVVDAGNEEIDHLFLDLFLGLIFVADADGVAAFVHLRQRRPVQKGYIPNDPRRNDDTPTEQTIPIGATL